MAAQQMRCYIHIRGDPGEGHPQGSLEFQEHCPGWGPACWLHGSAATGCIIETALKASLKTSIRPTEMPFERDPYCVTFGKSPNMSKFQGPHFQTGNNTPQLIIPISEYGKQ